MAGIRNTEIGLSQPRIEPLQHPDRFYEVSLIGLEVEGRDKGVTQRNGSSCTGRCADELGDPFILKREISKI